MAGEATTIARPYAEAVFNRAVEAGDLETWSDMLGLLAAVVKDPAMSGLIANPKLDKAQVADIMFDVCGDQLSNEGRNLVRLLVENGRLNVLADIAGMFDELKNQHQGALDVHVTSAYAMDAAQEQQLAEALKKKLGRDINISSDQDPELIGGVKVRAGDLVIDGSVQGQLSKLANVLGI